MKGLALLKPELTTKNLYYGLEQVFLNKGMNQKQIPHHETSTPAMCNSTVFSLLTPGNLDVNIYGAAIIVVKYDLSLRPIREQLITQS